MNENDLLMGISVERLKILKLLFRQTQSFYLEIKCLIYSVIKQSKMKIFFSIYNNLLILILNKFK